MDQEISFGAWMRKRRDLLGLTREAIAKQVGYSVAMIRKIEDDERRPTPQAAALLAQALGIPAEQQDTFLKVARQERAAGRLNLPPEEEPFPWQAAAQPQTNLPLPVTPFVGREAELGRLAGLLRDPAIRLVVLTGLAGIGKTRLALQAARARLDQFPQGVFYVSLASLDSHELIATSTGSAIGFQFYEAADPQEQLLRYLRERQMLLVLDNFEHLMEGADLLHRILQSAPGVRLLVTSRERLNLQGEWVFEVRGLPFPPGPEENGPERVEAYEAVQLFLETARRVHPAFTLNEESRACVVRICRLVEGMPLGIELAAAWVRALSCQQIALEIENNLDFLRAYVRAIPERHRSLRAALDCSWDLLLDGEKRAFRRLSVFQGGFRRESAQAVAGAGLEELASLLDKSLVKRAGEERYDLHELVRQYAAFQLQDEPQEQERTQERHSSHYAGLLESWGKKIASPGQVEALAEMDAEMDNVRQAWSWMVKHGQIEDIQKSLPSLWRYHDIRGRFYDGAALMGQAARVLQGLEAAETGGEGGRAGPTEAAKRARRSILLGRVLAQQGYFYSWLGRYDEARAGLQQSLALLRAGTDRGALAFALAVLGYMHTRLGEFQVARQQIEESLSILRALGDYTTLVYCLVTLSYIHQAQGNFQAAYDVSSEGLALSRDLLNNPLATEHCLLALSAAASCLGRLPAARRWAEESLQLSRELNHRSGIGYALKWLGRISSKLGEPERARALLRQSVSQFAEIGDRPLYAETLVDLGAAALASGAEAEAKHSFQEALRAALETQTHPTALLAVVELAALEMRAGSREVALEWAIHCLQHPSARREAAVQAEALRAELAGQLTPQQIEAAGARAKVKSLGQLAQEILSA